MNEAPFAAARIETPVPSSRISAEKAVAWLIAGTLVLRLAAGWAVGLGYGESYHFSCAIRPSMSYFDHPPLAVLLANLSMSIAGEVSPLSVRMPFILLFAGTTWILFCLGRKLYSPWAGFYAALMLNLSAVFTLSTGIFLQSDGPLMFFWLACIYLLTSIFFDAPKRPTLWWLAAGVILGLAMLSKYHAVFLILGTFLFIATRRDQWSQLASPGPYLACIIALAVSSPVIIWNYEHHWISFLWQGNRGVQGNGIRWDWLFRNIGGQALWLLPWIWAPLLWELCASLWKGPANKVSWFVAMLAVSPIVLFTIVSAYAPIGFHFHWQAPGYILLLLPLGATIDRGLSLDRTYVRWWLRGTVAFTCLSLAFVTTHAATGWWRAVGPQWLSEKFGEPDDPTLECLDYHPLEAAFERLGLLDQRETFAFTNRWFQSGKVDYAVKGRMPVLCLHPNDPRSFAFFDNPDQWLGKDGILVATKKFLDDPSSWYGPYFEKISLLETVPVPRGSHVEETLYIYRCQAMKKPFPLPYK